jgi:hypothetical protein
LPRYAQAKQYTLPKKKILPLPVLLGKQLELGIEMLKRVIKEKIKSKPADLCIFL